MRVVLFPTGEDYRSRRVGGDRLDQVADGRAVGHRVFEQRPVRERVFHLFLITERYMNC